MKVDNKLSMKLDWCAGDEPEKASFEGVGPSEGPGIGRTIANFTP